jgi:uncharacterized heparinase superfamily protein
LNKRIEVKTAQDWNDPQIDKLLLYHLHYHDALHVAVKAPVKFDGSALIDRWIEDNPPAGGNGWEPYPLSLRIVNWVKWHLEGNVLRDDALASLFLQARGLAQQIEYHLLANHILANAKALYFAGLFFKGAEATKWKQTAINILRLELGEQILDDGGHFELSPMYHATLTEDVLDIWNIGRAYDDTSFGYLPDLAQHMIHWLAAMSHGDGGPAYFNDATIDIAPVLEDLVSYLARLGLPTEAAVADGICHLKESGYARFQHGPAAVIMDIGRIGPDFQPGHAHCDCLSFELSIGDARVLVNSGVSTYNADNRRLLERQTASHNTVSIEGHEQSEVWSAFRVGRRARPFDIEVGDDFVTASHDGYRQLGITHRRRIVFRGNGLTIDDRLDAKAPTRGIARYHFHPHMKPNIEGNVVRTENVSMEFSGAVGLAERKYEYSQGFNKLVDARVIEVSFVTELTTTIDYANTVHIG